MGESPKNHALAASAQTQFLNVISRDEAEQRFRHALTIQPLGDEVVALPKLAGRVLAQNVIAPIDVPGFDRSNVDGFAVRSANTAGAQEESPRRLRLNLESLLPGVVPQLIVGEGSATPISTGGMVPRGADAVLMIEQTDLIHVDGEPWIEVQRAAAPGEFITYAGTDIARGETVIWKGQFITSREIGVLASLGQTCARVNCRPAVAILSTGNEVVAPGQQLPLGAIYDSNAAILAEAVREQGGEPVLLGCIPDDLELIKSAVNTALQYDVVLLSGGTSKGAGDLSYQVVSAWQDPGIVAHGVALKPGKPICLAVTQGKPVVILPGFPTSAIFTFHEFVAPVIRGLAGLPVTERTTVPARLPMRVHSDRGRTEYLLVRLFGGESGLTAYPLGKGSGAVTTFSQADGFLTISAQAELLEAGESVEVTLLNPQLSAPDLVVIGSHCVGLDFLLAKLRSQGYTVTAMHVGSQGGLQAAARGECDVAGVHLFDAASGTYNQTFVPPGVDFVKGYGRQQCFVFRRDDLRFKDLSAEDAIATAARNSECVLVNRNPGSGTRILLDELLKRVSPNSTRPPGYGVQVKSHNAVAAAIQQGRADWGIAIETVATSYGLATIPLQQEDYDFLIPATRRDRPAVQAFLQLLCCPEVRSELDRIGFRT